MHEPSQESHFRVALAEMAPRPLQNFMWLAGVAGRVVARRRGCLLNLGEAAGSGDECKDVAFASPMVLGYSR